MRDIFAYDGPFISFLSKIGEIIMLSIVTIICCIPIVTIGPALISLYYAMIKSVVHERGGLMSEYFKSFKRVFVKGMLVTLIAIVWFGLLYYGRLTAIINLEANPTNGFAIMRRAYEIVMVLSAALLLYLFPVMSRFENKLFVLVKLAFVMSIRYFYITLLLIALLVLLGWLMIFWIPVMWGLIIPGFVCFGITFLMEKPLLRYMPPVPEDADDWYHEKVTFGKARETKESERDPYESGRKED